MKNIKQIRENFDIITEKEEKEERKLSALVRAGLYDAKKLPALKKALEKSADKMTSQEKRMLLNLLDSLISQVTSDEQIYRKVKQNVHNVSEAKEDYYSKFDPKFKAGYPTDKDMPSVLILKRKAIRVYPDNQKVALYYSQALDKYVTIPFNDIQFGLNEAKKSDDEKDNKRINIALRKNSVNYKKIDQILKTGKFAPETKTQLAKKTVDRFTDVASRVGKAGALGVLIHDYWTGKKKKRSIEKDIAARKDPTSSRNIVIKNKQAKRAAEKIKTQRTSKIDAWKQSGKHNDLSKSTPPKSTAATHSSFQGKVRSMAQKSVIEEVYYSRLQELREAREYGKADAALDAASFLPGPAGTAASLASAGMSLSRGDYVGAALDAAGALPIVGYAAKAAKVSKLAKSSKLSKGGKITDASRLAKRSKALERLKTRKGGKGKWLKRGAAAAGLAGATLGGGTTGSQQNSNAPTMPNYSFSAKPPSTSSSWQNKATSTAATQQRDVQLNRKSQQALMREDVLSTMKDMIDNDIREATVTINEQEININNSVAKKILFVYESVNKPNKKKMEKMLNESATSFNKVLTFALRQ